MLISTPGHALRDVCKGFLFNVGKHRPQLSFCMSALCSSQGLQVQIPAFHVYLLHQIQTLDLHCPIGYLQIQLYLTYKEAV